MGDGDDYIGLNLVTNIVERASFPAFKSAVKNNFRKSGKVENQQEYTAINKHPFKRKSTTAESNSKSDDTEYLKSPANKRKRATLPNLAPSNPKYGDSGLRGVASSLFKSNPEIPEIKQKEFEQIKEKVFSKTSFEDINVHPYLISNLNQTFSINRVTAVQEKVIPLILNGEDVLVKSQTGSGKSLAYALPIIQKLQSLQPKISRESGIFALIVLPTRELALQTYDLFHKLLRSFTWIVSACFMGGQKRKSEKASIRRGVNVLVTTPQRLLDHLETSEKFSLSKVAFLVLDEADRLMDLGYETAVKSIVSAVKEQISEGSLQTILLSATLTQGVQKLAGLSMKKPITVDIAYDSSATSIPDQFVMPVNLHQYFLIVPAKLRLVTLIAFILWKCRSDDHKILVFMPTQDMVDYHDKLLSYITGNMDTTDLDGDQKQDVPEDKKSAIHISQLHGNMPQQERNEVFKKFRQSKAGVLLCTDVGSRGLDLPAVHWIVQYNAPLAVADYVHRVGRTARIGKEGNALLFLLPSESGYVPLLEENGIRLQQLKADHILQTLDQVHDDGLQGGKRLKAKTQTTEEAATALHLKCERFVRTHDKMHEYAKKAFLSFVRAYHTYPSTVKHAFPFKELHLGHVAKSLALQDTPSTLGSGGAYKRFTKSGKTSNERYAQERKQTSAPNPKLLLLSEYASGL